MNYLDFSTVTDRKCGEAPPNRSRTGYGSKIATGHQLQVAGRWHRVYAICWSNAATLYVLVKGEPQYIATGELS